MVRFTRYRLSQSVEGNRGPRPMQADPRIKIGSVVAAIPGNPMSTRWVVQEIRQRSEHTDYYGRGLGAAFPESMNTNHSRPPELLYENWQDAVAAFSMAPQLAAQIQWLMMPQFKHVDLQELNQRWKPELPPLNQSPNSALYVELWGSSRGGSSFKIGLTPDHYLILSRSEALQLQASLAQLMFEGDRT